MDPLGNTGASRSFFRAQTWEIRPLLSVVKNGRQPSRQLSRQLWKPSLFHTAVIFTIVILIFSFFEIFSNFDRDLPDL
jgi:hypothetical protein